MPPVEVMNGNDRAATPAAIETCRCLGRSKLLDTNNMRIFHVIFNSPCARRCTGLASGHATNAIDVTSGQPLMRASHGVQDCARVTKIYPLCTDVERGRGATVALACVLAAL